MALVVEDGTGKADANSYVDPTGSFATDYLAGHLYADAWIAASSPQRETAVRMASRVLDQVVSWKGRPSTTNQALRWPRYGVRVDYQCIESNVLPRVLKEATMELAIELLKRNRTSDTATSQPVESLNLGDGALQLSFGSDPVNEAVSILPPMVLSALRDLGDVGAGAGGGMSRIYRA